MAGTIVADTIQADSTSTLVLKNGVANTPPTIQDSAGTQIGTFCRAWVNFNGTGTVAIRASFNVSSITDNGTGAYTVNFTTAMPDANFSCVANAINDGVANAIAVPNVINANGFTLSTVQTNAITTAADVNKIYAATFR
jgi:uncharacterized Fe-S radical SAM superfamily protein PflX